MLPRTGQRNAENLAINTRFRSYLTRHTRRFSRDEDGAMLVFAVYIFIMILMFAGIGVDLMRVERDRAKLQYTLDRAVLAAADLDQTQEPSAVVADYFAKAGLTDYLANVTVDSGIGYRVVSAKAEAEIRTQFMHMTGRDTLIAPASSTAEERIDGVEISLVLDVSGSMTSNNRLTNLKVAARDFVDNMVDNSEAGKLSISIIPYATQVSTPDEFISRYNISEEHEYSNCVNFESSDFSTAALSTSQALERTMHFDVWTSNSDGRSESPSELVDQPVCEADEDRELLVMQNDRDVLKTYISSLSARGNTSIDVGMKWGTVLLDPGTRPVIVDMIDDGFVPEDFTNRPHDYDDSDALKVIVLMTDGQNTSQYYVDEDYREGASNIWWNEDEEVYSVYYSGYNAYYWPHYNSGRGIWSDHPYGQDGWGCLYSRGWQCSERTWDGDAVQLNYPELWAYTPLQYNVEENYEPWMNDNSAWNEWYYGVRKYVNSTTKNTRTQAICNAAKDNDVIVYTIGFEAPSAGEEVLEACASSPSHFFDVEGLEISDAFAAIASSIRKLRLTQ